MAKYKNIQELADAFKAGKLEGWVLMVDNDCTSLDWRGPQPEGIKPDTPAGGAFEEQKYNEGHELWDGSEVYILDQALTAAGIPNEGV
ncbi:hypothetical protein LCGC14_1652490 [marine sediment metagenome]|uniref:Uncharacterized protein n=1 Tax=marine sediment metagenome TaxID=412755 RepID=A0A0F9KWQ6_9ZZZZ